jgi:dihydroxyacetone kinase-like predicted kinase
LSIDDFIECIKNAKEIAYKAVITPIEGTILTVIRVVSETLVMNKQIISNYNELFKVISDVAEKTLLKTPELLPDLKEANVVDSGGYGLCRIFEGMNVGYNLEESKPTKTITKKIEEISDNLNIKHNPTKSEKNFVDNNDGFGYCNEFIMDVGSKVHFGQKNKEKFNFELFKKDLAKVGDSVVCVQDGNLVKVHIHSINP